LGFSDNAWPLRARANPFLPLAAQIAVGIPQASVEGAWQFAQQATQHLLTAADEIVSSHTNRENDQALRPSPLMEHLALTPAENVVDASHATLYQTIQQSAQIEKLENDFAAPELASDVFRGGTALFKYQAACPFRAFAQVRLNAQAWPTPRIGLDASERGQILHRAMELLWLKLVTQAKLLALDETEQTKQVNDAASKALEDWQQKNHHPLPKRFKAMETRRLTALIQDWLTLEKQRQPFTVLGTESEKILPLAGLTIRLRQDRIDQLPDGSVAIMDYKTGKPGGLPWKDDTGRPDEPQLPLYALASDKPVSALLFGKMKTGESSIIGIADTQLTLEAKIKGYEIFDGTEQPTLEQRIETWREELTQLAHNFRAGDAQVDPKKPAACQYCHLTSLCRKNEILDVGFLAEEVEASDHDE
jgi:probable DNA repair protein